MASANKAIFAIETFEELREAMNALNAKQRELQRYTANKFSVGNWVQFKSRTGKTVKGQIVKINTKTIKVKETDSFTTWTVSPSLLSRQGV